MNEGQVSLDGQTIPLPEPFFVIATQNPQDFAGTFPLPESQLDRFLLRVRIGYPPAAGRDAPPPRRPDRHRARRARASSIPRSSWRSSARSQRVTIDASLANYLHALIQATRTLAAPVSRRLHRAAPSRSATRPARARSSAAANYCIADDIHDLAVPVLAHRVRLATHADGFMPTRDEAETAVREIVARVPVPL